MCGIFGIFSNNPVINPILTGLSKLEYRGYDSSGISVLDNSNSIITIRAKGKLENLNKKIKTNELFEILELVIQDGLPMVCHLQIMLILMFLKMFQLFITE